MSRHLYRKDNRVVLRMALQCLLPLAMGADGQAMAAKLESAASESRDIDNMLTKLQIQDATQHVYSGTHLWYLDSDGDTYGDPDHPRRAIHAPPGYVSNNGDCDDSNNSVHPNAAEICDDIDQNCDGQVDEGLPTSSWYRDLDGDGYGGLITQTGCAQPPGYVDNSGDCNDDNPDIHPEATEVKTNGRDDDCDGVIDERVIAVEAGDEYSLALMSDGSVWSWGLDESGRLGNGPDYSTATPHVITFQGAPHIVQICAGDYHAMALDSNGNAYAWGANSSGQLGNGGTTWSDSPTSVRNLFAPDKIACGGSHSMALKQGQVYVWGDNSYGQLGDGTLEDRYSPTAINLGNVTRIAAGWLHSLAILSSGGGVAWGNNGQGQLGIGYPSQYESTPTAMSFPSGTALTGLAGGSEHSTGVSTNGTAWGWGDNGFSEVGDCTSTDRPSPVVLGSLQGRVATQVDSGMRHSLLLMSDRTLYSWGAGSYGALGYGGTQSSSCPVPVSGLSGVIQVSAGKYHSLALLQDGSVYAWGRNGGGELGDGTYVQRNSPVPVLGF